MNHSRCTAPAIYRCLCRSVNWIRRSFASIALYLALAFPFLARPAQAQQFVIFKVHTPFDMGLTMPDSARVNDYYVRLGIAEGAQTGMILNVYRDREIASDIGNFSITDRQFIGRMRTLLAHRDYTIARVTELADYHDPHRVISAVLIGDFVQPVFVVESENLFDPNSSTLRPEAERELDRAILFIKRFQPVIVHIEGHTDSDGEENFNINLSQLRANSVKAYLVNPGGIDEDILVPVGYGASRPIASNETPEGKRKNRRFEIVIER